MYFTLQNEKALVTVASAGAELVSLKNRHHDLNYIWQANPDIWGRHAPILFPIVGRLQGDTLRLEGNHYPLSQHGFARDSEFTLVDQQSNRLTLQLRANENTRSRYPFEFELTVQYELIDETLAVRYEVQNPQPDPIYFSIGSHPGLTCPILPGTQFEAYELQWEKPETLNRHYLTNGLRDGRQAPLMQNSDRLPLSHDLFQADALIVQGAKSQRITLAHHTQGPIISCHFEGYPYLGIWTKPDPKAEFICIEPWHGIADPQGEESDFRQKEGIIQLDGGEHFQCGYRLETHPQTLG